MLLMTKGYLEQKQIADYAMQPTKDTRETLYKMLRSGLVVLQDIPRTADRAPSRTLYVWGADLQGAFKNLGRKCWGGWRKSQSGGKRWDKKIEGDGRVGEVRQLQA